MIPQLAQGHRLAQPHRLDGRDDARRSAAVKADNALNDRGRAAQDRQPRAQRAKQPISLGKTKIAILQVFSEAAQ